MADQSPEDQALDAQAQDLLDKTDAFINRVLNLHDVGRALPHPYDAVGDMATGIAHDFINVIGYSLRQYVERTRPNRG